MFYPLRVGLTLGRGNGPRQFLGSSTWFLGCTPGPPAYSSDQVVSSPLKEERKKEVELVHNDLARKFQVFSYTLGEPQPKTVSLRSQGVIVLTLHPLERIYIFIQFQLQWLRHCSELLRIWLRRCLELLRIVRSYRPADNLLSNDDKTT